MQGLPFKGLQGGACARAEAAGLGPEPGAVGRIAQNGVPDMGEMDPDLVSPPCFQGAREEACHRLSVRPEKALQDLPMGDSRPAVLAHGLFVARVGVAPESGRRLCPSDGPARPRPKPYSRA